MPNSHLQLQSHPQPTGVVWVRLLDGFVLSSSGADVTLALSAQRLVAFLALRKRPLLRTHVAGVLWPDSTEAGARASLRSAIWRVRDACPSALRVTPQHIGLGDDVVVDIREVEERARLVMRDDGANNPHLDAAGLDGEVLPDWYDDWVLTRREGFRQMRLHALERLCERLSLLSRHAEAVAAGMAAVAIEPLRESAHRVVIRAHLAEGNRVEALRQYDLCCELLDAQLGIGPSPLLRGLID